MPRYTAAFSITAWEPADAAAWAGDARLGRVTLRKTYTGALDGTAVAEMLTCMADPADYGRGAVYTAIERFEGTVDGRAGTVVFQHGAVSGGDAPGDPAGIVVPNSGTGALAGIAGTVAIVQGADGHALVLDATFP